MQARKLLPAISDRPAPLATLVRLANDAGLHLVRRTGLPLACNALFTPFTPCTRKETLP
jgi:hypothetical protein